MQDAAPKSAPLDPSDARPGSAGSGASGATAAAQPVHHYQTEWPVNSLAASPHPSADLRVLYSSYRTDPGAENHLRVCGFSAAKTEFRDIAECTLPFPASQVSWDPSGRLLSKPLIACSTNILTIYDFPVRVRPGKTAKLTRKCSFLAPGKGIDDKDIPPLTSFDWSTHTLQNIVTSSVDTTCTIWDLHTLELHTQLITHDCPVYDVCWAPSTDLFGAVGDDGTLRLFDLRTRDRAMVFFCHPNQQPLVRLSFSSRSPRFIATIGANDNNIYIIDTREPTRPYFTLSAHSQAVSALTWAQHSSSHLLSASDSGDLLIWRFSRRDSITDQVPTYYYSGDCAINNIGIFDTDSPWVVGSNAKGLHFLRI